MKNKKLFNSLIEKSIASMVSAVELYNKPDFKYREENFCILATNAWELLLKAHLIETKGIQSIESRIPYKKKDGCDSSTKQVVEKTDLKLPRTISITEAIKQSELSSEVKANLKVLQEYRNNAIHFANSDNLAISLQEIGQACVQNYITLLRNWGLLPKIKNFHWYLMPLAFLNSTTSFASVSTVKERKFVDFVQRQNNSVTTGAGSVNSEFAVAIKINVQFLKSAIGDVQLSLGDNGISIQITDFDERFPLTFSDLVSTARMRYIDFKNDKNFQKLKKEAQSDPKLSQERKLNPNKQKPAQWFYSADIWHRLLDKHYTRK